MTTYVHKHYTHIQTDCMYYFLIVAHDIALPSYAYRRGSVQEKLPPSVMYRKLLKDSIINTAGLDPLMIEVRL